MKTKIKRPLQVYLLHALWIYLTTVYAVRNSSDFGRLTLIAMVSIGTVSFISLLVRRNYFEIKNNSLIIYKEFFRKQSIALNNIARVNIGLSPFTPSEIILKDGKQIKYWDSQAKFKEVRELLAQFNIPVE